jgi:hypothetical protein
MRMKGSSPGSCCLVTLYGMYVSTWVPPYLKKTYDSYVHNCFAFDVREMD